MKKSRGSHAIWKLYLLNSKANPAQIGLDWLCYLAGNSKEIVERRHGEPKKFLFLPKMGLLVVMNYEQLLRAVFSCFRGQKFNF